MRKELATRVPGAQSGERTCDPVKTVCNVTDHVTYSTVLTRLNSYLSRKEAGSGVDVSEVGVSGVGKHLAGGERSNVAVKKLRRYGSNPHTHRPLCTSRAASQQMMSCERGGWALFVTGCLYIKLLKPLPCGPSREGEAGFEMVNGRQQDARDARQVAAQTATGSRRIKHMAIVTAVLELLVYPI